MSKPGIGKLVLEFLADESLPVAALIGAIVTSGYGASAWKLNKRRREIEAAWRGEKTEQGITQQRFYSLLSRLKKEGLIDSKEKRWFITKNGRAKLDRLKSAPLPERQYRKEIESSVKIIIFDIPEKERKKRNWLREKLITIDFRMLQKSVWWGKTKIPEDFLEDLKFLGLLLCVDIFSIAKSGSLRKFE